MTEVSSSAATPEERLADTAVPKLARGVRTRWDEARDTTMLLAPERALRLDPIAAAILGETDGVRTFAEIVDSLAEKYAAPRDQIAVDVRKLLVDLMDKRMLEVTS
ncbi:Pyrroloquinoline quinone biosynthesis protein D [Hartmannibacter diazotrophicus]|uniref:Pyrroloquinoline quinone biosynthesis protein D n=1 Tax=Hartmannibacter diazotrophicus TaxID=1482074 RepID=A0A2C9D5Z5_9HYPH|nr:pyrroloquinoline quinone biosynthesis peptide chaperone PqqD [Hartmannibacter diazotrophicus]SON55744.1 Pyrroloquinoline quinone biosynthesis protein D [Hartmannibacter diazotrophicus]